MSIVNSPGRVRLSLGPIQYHWPKEKMLDFYRAIESTPVDIVYLGETVCSKRRSFQHKDWIEVAERLRDAGKEVILSTLALLEANSELGYVRRLCNSETFTVEANDMSAVQMLAGKVPFVGGATLNVLNQRSLQKLVDLGLQRWVVPVEASRSMLAEIREHIAEPIEYEMLAWGRLPLAYSARCYTARAHNLPKDECQFKCLEYPDGLMLETQENKEFLVLNGIQTQSALTHQVLEQLDELATLGVDVLRISPQHEGTMRIIEIFDATLKGTDPGSLIEELISLLPLGACNGYLLKQAGMDYDDSRAA